MLKHHLFLPALFLAALCVSARPASATGSLATPHGGGLFATDPGGLYNAAGGPDGVAADVNGHRILTRDVQALCLRRYRAPIIDRMIQNYVIERESAARGIVVSDAEIDARVAILKAALAPETLDQVMARHHTTLAEVQADFKHDTEKRRLVAGQVPPAAMTRCRAVFVRFAPEGAPPSVVGTARTEAEASARIYAIKAQTREGKTFASFAALSDPIPSGEMGDGGVFYPGVHGADPALAAAALALHPGEVSDPVRTGHGYWLLQGISRSISAGDAPGPEDAALYKAARLTYIAEQSEFLSPPFVVGLIEHSKITFASDADCDPPAGRDLPGAAATVDGHAIPMAEVAARCLADNGPRTVDILVQNLLVDDECRRVGIAVTPTDVEQRVAALRRLIAPHTLDEGLAARHMTLADLQNDFHQEIERMRLVENQVPSVPMVHCRAIIVKREFGPAPTEDAPGAVPRDLRVAQAAIARWQAQVKRGADFGRLAADCAKTTAGVGSGDLGIVYPAMHDRDTALLAAALSLHRGQTTPAPVTTADSCCLIQVVSTRADHPKSEDAAYAAALDDYKTQAAPAFVFPTSLALLQHAKIAYYLHA